MRTTPLRIFSQKTDNDVGSRGSNTPCEAHQPLAGSSGFQRRRIHIATAASHGSRSSPPTLQVHLGTSITHAHGTVVAPAEPSGLSGRPSCGSFGGTPAQM